MNDTYDDIDSSFSPDDPSNLSQEELQVSFIICMLTLLLMPLGGRHS
jgi:hypothetical protein